MMQPNPATTTRVISSPAIKDGAVLVIHGEKMIFEGSIRDQIWIEHSMKPGAVTLMDPKNKERLDAKIAAAMKGAPIEQKRA